MAHPTPVLGGIAQRQTQALADHTRTAAYTATAPLVHALNAVQAAATNDWIRTTGDIRTPPTPAQASALAAHARARVTTAMTGQAAHAQRIAAAAARTSSQLGTQQATAFARHAGVTAPAVDTPPVEDATAAGIDQLPHGVQQDHDAAIAMLTGATLTALGIAAIAAAVNRARRAAARIRATVGWAITQQVAAGVAAAARAIGRALGTDGVVVMWVAEPGACPACKAYAGHTVQPGHRFPGGLSTDPAKVVYPGAITGPPRHFGCRCTTIPWHEDWQDPTQPPMAAVLLDLAA